MVRRDSNKPKYFPSDVVQQADEVIRGWRKNRKTVRVNGLSPDVLESELENIREIEEELGRLKKRTNRLKSELSPAKRELFEAVQKVRNGARAAFGLHDKRLADFGLNPNIRRGRPPKKKFGKQLGLGLLETGEQD